MENILTVSKDEIDQLLQTASEQSKLSFSGKHGQPIPESMARRNARERTRVHQLNATFDVLRKRLPYNWRKGRLSKCGILRKSTEYIQFLLNELSRPLHSEVSDSPVRKNGYQFPHSESTEVPEGFTACSDMYMYELHSGWSDSYESHPASINGPTTDNMAALFPGDNLNVPIQSDYQLPELCQNPRQSNYSSCMYDKTVTSSLDHPEGPQDSFLPDVTFTDL